MTARMRGFAAVEVAVAAISAAIVGIMMLPYLTGSASVGGKHQCHLIKDHLYRCLRGVLDQDQEAAREISGLEGDDVWERLRDRGFIKDRSVLVCPGREGDSEDREGQVDYRADFCGKGELIGVECTYDASHNRP